MRKKHFAGLNLLDRVMKANSIKDMLRIIKPCISKDKYAMLKRAVKTHKNRHSKRDCIIRYAQEIMSGKH